MQRNPRNRKSVSSATKELSTIDTAAILAYESIRIKSTLIDPTRGNYGISSINEAMLLIFEHLLNI